MNILEIEDLIKGLPDQALMQEAQQPSGRMPQYLVVSEIQRRGDMRKRFQAQQQGQDRGTIAQQILQGGVQEGPAPQMQAPMGQPPGMMPPQGPPQGIAAMAGPRPPQGPPPQVMPPQGIPGPQAAQMAAQAPVRMAEGRSTPNVMGGLIQGVLPEEDLGRGTGIQRTFASQLYGDPREQQEQVGAVLRQMLGETNVPFTRSFWNPEVYDPERQSEIERGLGVRKDLQYLYGAVGPEQQEARASEIASRFPLMDVPSRADGELVSDPKESGAVQTDASRININAGYPTPGQTTLDEDLLEMGAADTDPRKKIERDLLGGVLGGAGRYAPGNVPSIGSVDPVAYAKGRIPADMQVEFDEEGVARVKGDRPGDILFNRYIEIMAGQDDPARSYKELLDTIAASRNRDYSEGTAAAAAIRSESEAEQKRLQEEGRSAALSDALIALGSGIAGGDLAGGLSRAGQAATAARREFQTAAQQERRYGTLEARAEERAARAARSAAEMQELGVKGRQIEADYERAINKNKRELAIGKAFVDRADALGIRQERAEELVVSAMETVSRNLAALAKEGQLTKRSLIGLKEALVKAVPAPFGADDQSRTEWAKTINDIYQDLASEYVGGGRGSVNPELERSLFGSIGER